MSRSSVRLSFATVQANSGKRTGATTRPDPERKRARQGPSGRIQSWGAWRNESEGNSAPGGHTKKPRRWQGGEDKQSGISSWTV